VGHICPAGHERVKKLWTWLSGHYVIACEVFYLVCRMLLEGSQAYKSKVYIEHLKLGWACCVLKQYKVYVSDSDIAAGLLISHMTMEGWEFWIHKYKMAVPRIRKLVAIFTAELGFISGSSSDICRARSVTATHFSSTVLFPISI
jgi:hypothetical protein